MLTEFYFGVSIRLNIVWKGPLLAHKSIQNPKNKPMNASQLILLDLKL